MVSIEYTDKFVRIRLRDPSLFEAGTFRTQDVGRDITKKHVDYSGRIAGILKKTGKYATQSYLIARYHPTGKPRKRNDVIRDVKKLKARAISEMAREKKGRGWHGESRRHSIARKRARRRHRR